MPAGVWECAEHVYGDELLGGEGYIIMKEDEDTDMLEGCIHTGMKAVGQRAMLYLCGGGGVVCLPEEVTLVPT